jgi:hypothetical protein
MICYSKEDKTLSKGDYNRSDFFCLCVHDYGCGLSNKYIKNHEYLIILIYEIRIMLKIRPNVCVILHDL